MRDHPSRCYEGLLRAGEGAGSIAQPAADLNDMPAWVMVEGRLLDHAAAHIVWRTGLIRPFPTLAAKGLPCRGSVATSEIHAWIWRHDPDGMFADFTPASPARITGELVICRRSPAAPVRPRRAEHAAGRQSRVQRVRFT